jgi:hypothetical protein
MIMLWIEKDDEGSERVLFKCDIPEFVWRNWEKQRQTSDKICCPADIRNKYFVNTNPKC